MIRSVIIAILLMLGSEGVAEEAQYERRGWPGEGRPVLIAKHNHLRLHREPNTDSPVCTIPYRIGWRIPIIDSIIRTIRSVDLFAKNEGSIEVYCDSLERVTLEAGEKLRYLQYRAEGWVMAILRGKVCRVPVFIEEEVFGEVTEGPEVEWWVRVVYGDGSSPGWLFVGDDQITYGRREF